MFIYCTVAVIVSRYNKICKQKTIFPLHFYKLKKSFVSNVCNEFTLHVYLQINFKNKHTHSKSYWQSKDLVVTKSTFHFITLKRVNKYEFFSKNKINEKLSQNNFLNFEGVS